MGEQDAKATSAGQTGAEVFHGEDPAENGPGEEQVVTEAMGALGGIDPEKVPEPPGTHHGKD